MKLMNAMFRLAIVAVVIASVSCLSNKETTWDWLRQEQDQYVETDRGYIDVYYASADRTPRWSSDGQTLVVNTGDRYDGDFAIYGVRLDGSALWRIPAESRGVQLSPVISSDNRVAYRNYEWISRGFIAEMGSSAHHHHVVVSSLDGAHEEWRVKLPVDVHGVGPAWMPDNAHLAVALNNRRGDPLFGWVGPGGWDGPGYRIFAVDGTGEFSLLGGYGVRPDKGFEISPDGRHAAYQSRVPRPNSVERLSDRVVISGIGAGQTGKHVTNGSLRSLATGKSNTWWSLSRAAWSSDGQQLFFAMAKHIDATRPVQAAIMAMAPDGSLETVADVNPPSQIYTVQPSPDGQRVLVTTRQGPGVGVVTLDGSRYREMCCAGSTGRLWASWSPDGERIAVLDTGRHAQYVLRVFRTDGPGMKTLIRRNPDGTLAATPDTESTPSNPTSTAR